MNITLNTAQAASATSSAAAPFRALSKADLRSGSSYPRPLTGFAAASSVTVGDAFSTTAAVNGRSIEIRVLVNRRARESYARATSLPSAVDPTAARTASTALAAAKSGRGRLTAASQWDR
jgi:hypothetical protein